MQNHSTFNLILVGYRGTGKSTVARELATTLGMPKVSLDEELVRRAALPIPELVAKHGWDHFRDLEQALVAELAERDHHILDCGGGVVERACNIETLRHAGTVFWLTARTKTIVDRIGGGADRPALTATMSFTEEVESVLTRRNPLYAQLAHVRIETDSVPSKLVAQKVAALWPNAARSPAHA